MISRLVQAWRKTNRWFRVIAVILIVQFGGLPQRKQGYYCNDPSLSHPYTGDTISWKFLLFTSFIAPIIFIISLEKFCNGCKCSKEKNEGVSTKKIILDLYKEYSYALLLNLALVQVLKIAVGAPRPHFFDVCQPDAQCEGSELVSSYKCVNSLYSYVRRADAGRSFPSGHTSVAVHTCLFIAWYLQTKKEIIKSYVPRYTVLLTQAFVIICGALCGISRITDRRHHWWDVLAGAVIGVAILVYMIKYQCQEMEYLNNSTSTTIYLETKPAEENEQSTNMKTVHHE